METICSIVTLVMEVGKCVCAPTERAAGYLRHYRRNIENLNKQVQHLRRRRDGIQNLVNEACRQRLEECSAELTQWLEEVEEAERDANRIIEAARDGERCLHGWCPSWNSRYRLSKEAEVKATHVKEIFDRGVFSSVSRKRPQPAVVQIPTNCEDSYESVRSAKKEVMEALNNDAIKLIGVYGMGGVGKTALIKKINNQLRGAGLFEKVILVVASKPYNLRRIQDAIAERLDLKIEAETNIIRADKLQERLKNEETVLIILDDVWGRIDIAELGIPFREEHQGCKIILTTRIENVCLQMGTDKMIKLEHLSEGDSWDLFRKIVGDMADKDRFHPIGRKIAKLCGGLPLAITVIASSLKVQTREIAWKDKYSALKETAWEKAYDALKNDETMVVDGTLPAVVKSLRFSYDHLKDEKIKLFFLLCCLFPEDLEIPVHDLIHYGIAERLMNIHGSLEDATERGKVFIDTLKANSLLMECGIEDYVMMHDVVRDVAIAIASKECGFFVKTGAGLKKWPEKKNDSEGYPVEKNNLEECTRISLMDNEITSLENRPTCPQLLTLLLRNNKCLERISNHFFEEMSALVVLDLSGTSIQQLPSSISCLKNLRTLCLDCCYQLKDISTIAGLDKLEILRLRFSGIAKLGEEIGGLVNLKHLDLGGIGKHLKIIIPNMISRLSSLEELYIEDVWEVEKCGDGRKAEFSEVMSLTRLTSLYMDVNDNSCLFQEYAASDCFKNLKTFHISLGCEAIWDWTKRSRILFISRGAISFPDWVKVLLSKAEELSISEINGLKNILQLHAGGFSNSHSKGKEPMIEAEDHEGIGDAFRKLKSLRIYKCNELKYMLFNSYILLKMCSLEFLKLFRCEKLTEVFNSQGTIEGSTTLVPKLTKLVLEELKSLEIIWKGTIPVGSLNSLKTLHVSKCGKLKYLLSPALVQTLENLEFLELICCDGIEKLISNEEESSREELPQNLLRPSTIFNSLRVIKIHACYGLKYVFTSRSVQHLMKLEQLSISSCIEMEEIISMDNQMMEENSMLPLLKTLSIVGMLKLTSICKGRVTFEWPSLTDLVVNECPNLKRLPLGSQSAPNLEIFKIESKERFDQLEWEDQDIKLRLQALLL